MDKDCEEFESFKTYTKKKHNKREKSSDNTKTSSDDFPSIFSDLFNAINYKVMFFLFIIGVMIFSDVFIELFLAPINGAVFGDVPTNKGTIIQLLVLTLGYVCADLLVKGQVI